MMWYVYFMRGKVRDCHCFEQDEEEARHFAKLVNGELYCGYKPVITDKEQGNPAAGGEDDERPQ